MTIANHVLTGYTISQHTKNQLLLWKDYEKSSSQKIEDFTLISCL